jgi:S1-C subfamily serine protease
MRHVLAAILILAFTGQAVADVPPPNVVRVFVEEGKEGMSMGTGTLVRPDLIVTNWHVVKDRNQNGVIRVLFPDWTVVTAKVVKTNKKWDLAALKIEPVKIAPMKFGKHPKVGDVVTVGGYGSGWFESNSGKIVDFYKPDAKSPGDIVNVNAMVRNGDSGGPIISNGKLVGVLFGCSDGTYGTDVGQVKRFLGGVK